MRGIQAVGRLSILQVLPIWAHHLLGWRSSSRAWLSIVARLLGLGYVDHGVHHLCHLSGSCSLSGACCVRGLSSAQLPNWEMTDIECLRRLLHWHSHGHADRSRLLRRSRVDRAIGSCALRGRLLS